MKDWCQWCGKRFEIDEEYNPEYIPICSDCEEQYIEYSEILRKIEDLKDFLDACKTSCFSVRESFVKHLKELESQRDEFFKEV